MGEQKNLELMMNAERILMENEGLVQHVVQHVVRRMVMERDVEDAAQEGRLGLLYAAERFVESAGAKFSTYACWCIKSRVLRWIEYRRDLVRVPVKRAREGVRVFVSGLDEPLGSGGNDGGGHVFCLADVLAAPAEVDEEAAGEDEQERLWAAVDGLKEPMRSVIRQRFSWGVPTFREVNEVLGLGLTRERVRQIESRGLRILRKRLGVMMGGR
jgi:RNA polymerase sigma factor (sigma-70 family)